MEASCTSESSLWALRRGSIVGFGTPVRQFGVFGLFWGLRALKSIGRSGVLALRAPKGPRRASRKRPRRHRTGGNASPKWRRNEFGAFAEIVVFLRKTRGFDGLGHPRIVALVLQRSGIVSFGALVRRFWVSGSTLGLLRHQVAL